MAKQTETAEQTPMTREEMLELLTLVIQTKGHGASAADINDILLQSERRTDPTNKEFPAISAFSNPKGDRVDPKPDLTRKTYANGIECRKDMMTPVEVLGVNALNATMPNPNDRKRSRNGRLRAEVSKNGDTLLIEWDCRSVEDQTEFNILPFSLLLKELADGIEVANPDRIFDRLAALEADNARLRGELATA